ncbi:hypothetical protein [Rivularia sp. UHCC 0363]|uniref:hypothetical protein n=1 Tax=Rivularia sp. UHCC 0363 TaxID=3110244 RepID=UPI002B21FE99|nr:hypothetical protein [Rivularia sp. UHCC 0363]MEA5595780.1 hypothetical protein [Rivularia sp. UHCC 0363]
MEGIAALATAAIVVATFLTAFTLMTIFLVFGTVAFCRNEAFEVGAFGANFSYKGA